MSWEEGPWKSFTTRYALKGFAQRAVEASPEHPILIDKFLEDAIEIDVDAVADGEILCHRRDHGTHRGRRESIPVTVPASPLPIP